MKPYPTASLLLLLAALLPLRSCTLLDPEAELRGLGFEVGADTAWSADCMAHTLRLSLASGEDGDCLFRYLIDGDPSAKLGEVGGGIRESGRTLSLSRGGTAVFTLPPLPSDTRHSIRMEFSREGVTRAYVLPLPDTGGNGIGVRVDADPALEFSRVVLESRMGASSTEYTVSFRLDGDDLQGIKYRSNTFGGTMTLSFAECDSCEFELPYLPAGEHVLETDVRSALGSESTRTPFTEPQRRSISLVFSYNPYSGKIMLESPFNPLGTAFDITVDICVEGEVTYRPKQFFGRATPRMETFSDSGEASVRLTPGLVAAAVDGGKLKAMLDKMHAITRIDACNAIGNGNARTLHAEITSVSLSFTVHSQGDNAGKTAVTVSPGNSSAFTVSYPYSGKTWNHAEGYTLTIHPAYTLNGRAPSAVTIL